MIIYLLERDGRTVRVYNNRKMAREAVESESKEHPTAKWRYRVVTLLGGPFDLDKDENDNSTIYL